MADRKNKFLIKRSNVAGKVPTAGDLLLGEMALNTADVILYTSGTTANSILPIGWDRVNITGGTISGDLTINGDLIITGNTTGTFVGDGSGLTGITSGSGDTFVDTVNWEGSGNTLTLTRNDAVILTTIIDEFSGLTITGLEMGDSRFKHWGEMYNNDNAIITVISGSGIPTKISGSTILGGSRGFIMADNRLTYTAVTTGQTFDIVGTVTGEADTGSQSVEFFIYKNGSVKELATSSETIFTSSKRSVAITGVVSLSQSDYIELWCQNNTSNKDVTVSNFTIKIVQI